MNNRMDYFFASLDFHLTRGAPPRQALIDAVEDYAKVFHIQDGRTELARAAEVSLERLAIDDPRSGEKLDATV